MLDQIIPLIIPPLIVVGGVAAILYRPLLHKSKHVHHFTETLASYNQNTAMTDAMFTCDDCQATEWRARRDVQPHEHDFVAVDRADGKSEFACRFCQKHEKWDDLPPPERHNHFWTEASRDDTSVEMHCVDCDARDRFPLQSPANARHVHVWKKRSTEHTNGYRREIYACVDCSERQIYEDA